MIELIKKEAKVKDKIKLFLTTGQTKEGIILELGEGYISLVNHQGERSVFKEGLIGGWEIMRNTKSIKQTEGNKTSKIDFEVIKKEIDKIIDITPGEILSTQLSPNAEIIGVLDNRYLAKTKKGEKLIITKNKIIDNLLIEELKNYKIGDVIPICCSFYQKDGINNVSLVLKPQKVLSILQFIYPLLKKRDIYKINTIIQFLTQAGFNAKKIIRIKNELKGVSTPETKNEKELDDQQEKEKEKEINKLIEAGQLNEALEKIEEILSKNIVPKYRSSFFLKKAQIFSSLNKQEESEKAYEDLIKFNLENNFNERNISHLYTELGRLQSLNISKMEKAIFSLKEAIRLNPNNLFAEKLMSQIEYRQKNTGLSSIQTHAEFGDEGKGLIIDIAPEKISPSELIESDIKDHNYIHKAILSNHGVPSPAIAKKILEEAKERQKLNLSDSYPLFLEAAKAFSELNIGSYNSTDYLEAISFYSMQKGNALYEKFRGKLLKGDFTEIELSRVKDSASSYYIEALSFLSTIDASYLLNILNNYLKLNILYFYVEKKEYSNLNALVEKEFSDTFNFCIKNPDKEIEKLAYTAIIDFGSYSINAWNALAQLPKGTGGLYMQIKNIHTRKKIYTLIEEIEQFQFNKDLDPGPFLKEVFSNRRQQVELLKREAKEIYKIGFEPQVFESLNIKWKTINTFQKFFQKTDLEIKRKIDSLILIIQPYLNRNQTERTNILIQASRTTEDAIEFIKENTTYFGRVIFYDLLKSWKKKIDHLLEEKISLSYPKLQVIIDPPYLLKGNDTRFFAPVIVKNTGDSTCAGFKFQILFESTVYHDQIIKSDDTVNSEIPSGDQSDFMIEVPSVLLEESHAVEVKFIIAPEYQGVFLADSIYEFTLEIEPESHLIYDDVPWKDGPIPEENMFKGRRRLIYDLAHHYLSPDRDKSYILYGLTRTGKSSVLKYLAAELRDEVIKVNNKEKKIIPFFWDFSIADNQANASDFYDYILCQCVYETLLNQLNIDLSPYSSISIKAKFKDFEKILTLLDNHYLYPIFFIDEFSFFKNLIDRKVIGTAFLHSIRQFSLNSMASFVFSGTYDIKSLIKDPKYGITGQLVNTIEEQINEIKPEHAEELITVMGDDLVFTPEAIEHVKFLSGNIPYFIQIICKNCGYFAVEHRRKYIGYPELEQVVEILTGARASSHRSLIKKLPEGNFQNNQFSPQDPREIHALISSLCFINKRNIRPRGVSLAELERLWGERELSSFRPKLSDSIVSLKEKKIIIQAEDEGIPIYTLAVDLFRRWWTVHHPDIDLELNTLKE